MPGKQREVKNPTRVGRAEAVRAATAEEWAGRGKAGLVKTGRDGLRLAVAKAPEFILDADGEVIGVDAWVQLFDEQGRELKIDPHRRIINPPTTPRAGVRLVDTGRADEQGRPVKDRILTADPAAAFWEAVWDSVEGAPNPKGWRTRGTVTTVYAGASDGDIRSTGSSYTQARGGTGTLTVSTTSTTFTVGQATAGSEGGGSEQHYVYEGFVSFDTSPIDDADTVSAAVLSLWLASDVSSTDFTIEVREKDWGTTLGSADFTAGANLSSLPLMASLATSGIGATGAYKDLLSEAAMLTMTNLKTGTVYLMASSSMTRLDTPGSFSSQKYVQFSAADSTGTTQDPKLTVTHAGPGSSPFFTSRPNRIWRLG